MKQKTEGLVASLFEKHLDPQLSFPTPWQEEHGGFLPLEGITEHFWEQQAAGRQDSHRGRGLSRSVHMEYLSPQPSFLFSLSEDWQPGSPLLAKDSKIFLSRIQPGASLVAQWLRIRLPMQGTRVRALVWEDPTCRGTTKPVSHNYWTCALEPVSHNYWACTSGACAPQQERPR